MSQIDIIQLSAGSTWQETRPNQAPLIYVLLSVSMDHGYIDACTFTKDNAHTEFGPVSIHYFTSKRFTPISHQEFQERFPINWNDPEIFNIKKRNHEKH